MTACCQDANGHRQVEACAFLANICGGHIDRDGTGRKCVAAVLYGSRDAFVAFFDGAIGQADKYEADAASGIHLNGNSRCLKALYAGAECLY